MFMETLKVSANIDADGHLRLDVATNLPAGNIELVIVIDKPKELNYDFLDLVGKLNWQGDAVLTQRVLRDEW
jgi:hypothetical protein